MKTGLELLKETVEQFSPEIIKDNVLLVVYYKEGGKKEVQYKREEIQDNAAFCGIVWDNLWVASGKHYFWVEYSTGINKNLFSMCQVMYTSDYLNLTVYIVSDTIRNELLEDWKLTDPHDAYFWLDDYGSLFVKV